MRDHFRFPLAALTALIAVSPAAARDALPFIRAPLTTETLAPKLATVMEFKLRVIDSAALSTALVEVGVIKDDVVSVADLSTGYLGEGNGCDAIVAFSKGMADGSVRIERVTLTTEKQQAIIDRRGDRLILATQPRIRARLPRIA